MPYGRPDAPSTTGRQSQDVLAAQLFAATRDAAAATHELLGTIQLRLPWSVAYLARQLRSGHLVILSVERDPSATQGGEDYALAEFTVLDASAPAPPHPCPLCHATLATWEPRCWNCGADASGIPIDDRAGNSENALLDTVRRQAGPRFEVLGAIPRASGGPAYFARERDTDTLVLMHLAPASGADATPVLTMMPLAPAPAAPPAGDAAAPRPTDTIAARPSAGAGADNGARDARPARAPDGWGLVGRVLGGRYRILHRLGEGGMGEVYLAEHLKMGRRDAIKVMRPSLVGDPEAVERFTREAYNASRISHQNVATVYDFGETDDGVVFLAMEYVPGRTLSDLLAESGALAPERAVAIARQVAEGLGAAHDLGIVHRDLKPDNILVVQRRDGAERVKVVDFGIAKAMLSAHGRQTRTGFVLGTPAYMSPEQLTGDPLDGRSDLYSLGCILYEMLTGESTCGHESGERLINRRLTARPPHPRHVDPRIPRALDDIVARTLARRPDDRIQTAAELDAELAAALTKSGGWRRLVPGWRADRDERARDDLPSFGTPSAPSAVHGAMRLDAMDDQPTVRLAPPSPAGSRAAIVPEPSATFPGATIPRQPAASGAPVAEPVGATWAAPLHPDTAEAPASAPPTWVVDGRLVLPGESVIEPPPEPPRRWPRFVLAGIAALAIVSAPVYFLVWQRVSEPSRETRVASAATGASGSGTGEQQAGGEIGGVPAAGAGAPVATDSPSAPPAPPATSASGALAPAADSSGMTASSLGPTPAPRSTERPAPPASRRAPADSSTAAAVPPAASARADSAVPGGDSAASSESAPARDSAAEPAGSAGAAAESTGTRADSDRADSGAGASRPPADQPAPTPPDTRSSNLNSVFAEWETDKPAVELDGNLRPGYRISLRREGVRDTISVQYVIDTTGSIDMTSVRLLRMTAGPSVTEFKDSLLAVLPSWRYTPAKVKGRSVRERLIMNFIY
ncbi:MAG TPA: protein kinase [Gemmatimonadaceae bacterium]